MRTLYGYVLTYERLLDSTQYKHLAEHVYNNTGPEYCLEGARLLELIFYFLSWLGLDKSERSSQTEVCRHVCSRMWLMRFCPDSILP